MWRIVGVFLSMLAVCSALQCWTCDNAKSDEDCMENGELQLCQENEHACHTEIRRGGWGSYPLITKRCKQGLACRNNQVQNDRNAWQPTQCNAKIPSSVCRCCCNDEDGCNKYTDEKCGEKVIVDPCQPNPCGEAGICTKLDEESYKCECPPVGFVLEDGICKELQCPLLGDVHYGDKRCDGFEGGQGTDCEFRCVKDDYELYPHENQVLNCNNGSWDKVKPCCARPCPDFAVMDLVVVMDSSSSVEAHNWEQMKAFVRSLLGGFTVAPDLAFLSVVRYNAQVDAATQILLNDFPYGREALLKKFDQIPYNGSGTKTGQAIDYVTDVLLKEGNRRSVQDIVLIITDGASQDDVKEPSRRLRETGAEVLVLPIKSSGKLDMEQINQMAGHKDANIFLDALVGGFQALDLNFASKVAAGVCKDPCRHVVDEQEIQSLISLFKDRLSGGGSGEIPL